MRLAGQRVVVAGAGTPGAAAARVLADRGAWATVVDRPTALFSAIVVLADATD
jgi:UDP-N-acetylmuramoylalanine-D-glutamate ligase